MRNFCLLSTLSVGLLGITTTASAADFTLTSTAAAEQGKVPSQYTCDGSNISPPLSWNNVPAKTQTLALIVADPDAPAGTFYHWVLYNIPKTLTQFPAGASAKLPAGIFTGKNSAQTTTYFGPCPPPGTPHHYIFTLYAIDGTLNLAPGVDAKQLQQVLQRHVLAQTSYTMVYNR